MTPPTSLIKSLFDIACLRVDKSDQQEMRWEVQWHKMFSSGSHSQSHLIMLWLHRLWLTAHWRISLNLTFIFLSTHLTRSGHLLNIENILSLPLIWNISFSALVIGVYRQSQYLSGKVLFSIVKRFRCNSSLTWLNSVTFLGITSFIQHHF